MDGCLWNGARAVLSRIISDVSRLGWDPSLVIHFTSFRVAAQTALTPPAAPKCACHAA